MSAAEAVGRLLGFGIPNGLMVLAAIETSSLLLRSTLVSWVIFAVAIQVAVAGGWRPPATKRERAAAK